MPEIAQQFMYVHRHSRGECTKRQMCCNWGQILHSQSICCSHDEWQFQYEKLQLQQIGHSIQRLSISTLHEDIRCSLRCFVHKVCVAYSRTVRRSVLYWWGYTGMPIPVCLLLSIKFLYCRYASKGTHLYSLHAFHSIHPFYTYETGGISTIFGCRCCFIQYNFASFCSFSYINYLWFCTDLLALHIAICGYVGLFSLLY